MSGKAARRLRKNMKFSKKTVAFAAGLCLCAAPVAADNEVLISLFPHFTKPFGETHSMEYGLGGGLKVTYRPVKNLNFFAQGDYLSMAMPGIDPIAIINGGLGAGYHLDVSDRVGFDFNVNIGAYNAKASKSIAGLSAGAQLGISYKINPVVSADVTASGTHFALGKTPLMTVNAAVSPGVTVNVTQMFNSSTNVEMDQKELAPVFPVLYSWYENNSFGKVEIYNHEDNAITDVTVSFYQPQYMAHPKECGKIKKIGKGESAQFDLYSFFNEQILELTEKTDTNSYVIVNYNSIGAKRTKTFAMDVPVYGRNNMSWDDDRRAAVFVSSKDPAAMQFAKYVTSIVRENFREDVPINIQYATGIFEALNEFGINYVIDPTSAFEDNVGTSAVDFLQFPYQTLMYKGGDCDDLSILFCSLFEAVGIRTAFITIPGHIYMAFDSGMTVEQAKATLQKLDDMIVLEDEVWVPLEITLTDEGFYKAHRVGAREWRVADASGKAALYKMQDSWQIYSPISAPGATASMTLPDSDTVRVLFASSVNEWGMGELKSKLDPNRPIYVQNIAPVPEQVTLMDTRSPYETDSVIRENPFTDSALLDVLALASNVVAVVPIPEIKEEDLEVFEDEDEEEKKEGPEPEAVIAPQVFEENLESSRSERLPEPVEGPAVQPVVYTEPEPEPVVPTPVEIAPEPEPFEPEPVAEPEPEPEPVVEPEPEPEPQPVVYTEPEPIVVPEALEGPQPEPVAEPEPVSIPELVVEPEPEQEPQPVIYTEPESVTAPQVFEENLESSRSERLPEALEGPKPAPVAELEPEPVVEPEPAPEDSWLPELVEGLKELDAVAEPEPEPTVVAEPAKPEKKSPLAPLFLAIGATAAAAGIFIFAKKKTKQKDGK
ncbi:MAG: hypothetical protein J5710_08120 [Treponema sp.]|nr:hypothetical protein [Treponema sp.]